LFGQAVLRAAEGLLVGPAGPVAPFAPAAPAEWAVVRRAAQ